MNIGVILGSTRPTRVGPVITKWMLQSITVQHSMNFEVIDLAEWDLPMFNEPEMPATGIYMNDKTKEWSKKIDSKDAFIFVTPQYNWGYPAALKNCVDYLKKEWLNKPAMIASYAHRTGGDKAAAQFRQVLNGLRMRPVETMPAISFTPDMFNEDGKIKEEYDDFNSRYSDIISKAILELELELYKPQVRQVVETKVAVAV
jgi:NAD(P)H-dependent FMN reductase